MFDIHPKALKRLDDVSLIDIGGPVGGHNFDDKNGSPELVVNVSW